MSIAKGRKGGVDGLFAIGVQMQIEDLERRLAALESAVAENERRIASHQRWGEISKKLEAGMNVTREEAATYLGVDKKTIARMDAAGRLRRCPGLRGAVRYAAGDVQRFASAPRKEA